MDDKLIANYVRMLLEIHCRKWTNALPGSQSYEDAIGMVEKDVANLREAVKRLKGD